MADPKKLIPIVKKWEGGFSNHPMDKGGPTMKGVTLKTFQKYYGKERTVEDLKRITEDQWYHIFKSGYWDALQADEIDNQSIANILVDWAWGSGPKTAIRQIQGLLGVKIDGFVGPITLQAINEADPQSLLNLIVKRREAFYFTIVQNNPSQEVFLKGWLNRLRAFVA